MSTAVLSPKGGETKMEERRKHNTKDLLMEEVVAADTKTKLEVPTASNMVLDPSKTHTLTMKSSLLAPDRKRKPRGPKKRRIFEEIPGSSDLIVHCSNKCGRFYRTAPCNLDRTQWHKTLRKLNAHESQRCMLATNRRSEKRKRKKGKKSNISKKKKKKTEDDDLNRTFKLPALEDESRGSDNSSSASSSPTCGETCKPSSCLSVTKKMLPPSAALSMVSSVSSSPRGVFEMSEHGGNSATRVGQSPRVGENKEENMSFLVQAVHLWLDRARKNAGRPTKRKSLGA